MRQSTILALMLVLHYPAHAENPAEQISTLCQRHSFNLVDNLKADVIPKIDNDQTKNIVAFWTESCQKYFNTFVQGLEKKVPLPEQAAEKAVVSSGEADTKDWFTKSILEGITVNKAGNRRLKRLKP